MGMWLCTKCGKGNRDGDTACWDCETMRDQGKP
jgi:hypothetical protein